MKKLLSRTVKLHSKHLNAEIYVDIFLPPDFHAGKSYPLFIMNDGQDMAGMEMGRIVNDIWRHDVCEHFVLAAVHAFYRMDTYGIIGHPDYKGRGKLAKKYSRFLISECIPFIRKELVIKKFTERIIGGFSLGGLSAFDIAWNNPKEFSKVMAASPSFWYRSRDISENYTDNDRIMHRIVRETKEKPDIKIWLQAGTLDEASDRNQNGIIDSVDDMLDLAKELKNKGFEKGKDLFHHEVIGGKHTLETYGIIIPYFVNWAFGKKQSE